MGKAEYTQEEADLMLGMAKRVPVAEHMFFGPPCRTTAGEFAVAFDAVPDAPHPPKGLKYKIEIRKNAETEDFAILLHAKVDKRRMLPLCRYDVHDSLHVNRLCCGDEEEMLPGVFQVHRYSEHCLRAGHEWDSCAKQLVIPHPEHRGSHLRQMIGEFVNDMQIKFSDSEGHQLLFRTGDS